MGLERLPQRARPGVPQLDGAVARCMYLPLSGS